MAVLNFITRRDAGDVRDVVVLCATHRLARSLRLRHDRAQAAQGLTRWQPLPALTAMQWLQTVAEEALLTGAVAAAEMPATVLTAAQERALWERIVAADSGDPTESLFFDGEGLAAAAAEANALIEGWGLDVKGNCGEETRRFLRWRSEFRRRCEAAGWCDGARAASAYISVLDKGAGRLPVRVLFAGFDRYTRQEERLAEALARRGCEVGELELGDEEAAAASAVMLLDRKAECRAAAAWAAARLEADPGARIGIVVPDLAGARVALADALDEILHPQTFAARSAESPRRYNFSLGTALSREPLVDAALRLLRLALARRTEQKDIGELLRGACWSADESEADTRARLDARMREMLPASVSMDRLLRFLRRQGARGLSAPRLLADLEAMRAAAAAQPARQLPSQWARAVQAIVRAAGWPGERPLSSREFQARTAFDETLEGLAQFDGILGRIGAGEALSRLAGLCRDRIFQPETVGDPPLQIVGPLEAAGMQFDALWVMGMNDDVWPAAASPNPLLPAELQRRAATPGASAEVESAFARAIHRRLLHSAPVAVFSWAQAEGERIRRPSPLVAGLPTADASAARATLAETLCRTVPLETLDDNRAPPVPPGSYVGGGANLLRAQALCPAWAFYRYRLGARALGAPAEGLDAMARGSLVHRMFQIFWSGRTSAQLSAMPAAELDAALAVAVDGALAVFNAGSDEPLPPRIAALERERLLALAGRWLKIEAARAAPFEVAACEQAHQLDIGGLLISLTVDRIDALEGGGRVVIDYKTGREPSLASWAKSRISEPQLPLYAAYLAGGEVAAVAFARLRAGEEGFAGIAADAGLLPEVAGLTDKAGRRRFPEADFPDWQSLLDHWRRAVEEIAGEVRDGIAAVAVTDERALEYCEVKPLLRLAERRSQRESLA